MTTTAALGNLAEALVSENDTRVYGNQHGTYVAGKAARIALALAALEGREPEAVLQEAVLDYTTRILAERREA